MEDVVGDAAHQYAIDIPLQHVLGPFEAEDMEVFREFDAGLPLAGVLEASFDAILYPLPGVHVVQLFIALFETAQLVDIDFQFVELVVLQFLGGFLPLARTRNRTML